MALPLKYNFQNVIVRWRSTLAAIFGIGLVVAVYVMLQALAVGLERNSANTGDERNYLIVRKGATSESVSQVTREQFRYLQYMEEIAKDEQGKAVVTADTMVLVNLPRLGGNGEANVLVRGVMRRGKNYDRKCNWWKAVGLCRANAKWWSARNWRRASKISRSVRRFMCQVPI